MADKKILFIIPKNKKFDSLKELADSLDEPVDIKHDEKSGYEALKKGSYDLVISTMFAGKLNGYELISKIKKDKIDCGVILIMSDKKERVKSELKKNGVFSFVSKSSDGDELSQQVKRFFKKKQDWHLNDEEMLECKKFALEDTVFELEQKLIEKTNELKYLKKKSKEVLDEFMDTKERLEKKREYIINSERMISLGQMTASIVHEINNPLTVITSIAGLISMEGNDEKITKYNKMLSEHIDNLRHYIHTILAFSRSRIDEEFENIDLHDAINDLLVFYCYELKKKEIQLERKFDPDLPKVKIPQVKLQQVVLNILKNATFAARKNGSLITIMTKKLKDNVVVEIKDNGCGIKKDELKEVMKPFYTTKSKEDGSGLGLYICNDIIKNHGGTLEIKSEYNKGTTVSFKLPCAKD